MNEEITREVKRQFVALGYEPIPIPRNEKKPVIKNWPKLPVEELWDRELESDHNLGLRCGSPNGLAVIDSDTTHTDSNPQTTQNVLSFLYGLGITDYPVFRTASGATQFYLSLRGSLEGSFRKLVPEIGTGEFRYGNGSQVITCPSEINGIPYVLVRGNLACLPEIEVKDILPLLAKRNKKTDIPKVIDTENSTITQFAWKLLKGEVKVGNKYKSRSELDQALMDSLIATGNDYESILELFNTYPTSGKYQSTKNPDHYFDATFNKAYEYVSQESETVIRARQQRNWINNQVWKGIARNTDKQILLAHADISARSGKRVYDASVRELAELAKVDSIKTASRSNSRLIKEKLLRLVKRGGGNRTHKFELLAPTDTEETIQPVSHDLFRRQGLGTVCKDVWEQILVRPQTLKELIANTGRSRNGIKNAIRKMTRTVDPITGEITGGLAMLEKREDEKYYPLPVCLDELAQYLEVSDLTQKQKEKHREQRKKNKNSYLDWKKTNNRKRKGHTENERTLNAR